MNKLRKGGCPFGEKVKNTTRTPNEYQPKKDQQKGR